MKIDPPERHPRILIVDDNRSIHADFQKILGRNGADDNTLNNIAAEIFDEEPGPSPKKEARFQLESAYQGQEALRIVENSVANRHRFSMAFMDVRMPPGWDGVETTAKIWEVDPDLQVVICTAYSDYSWEETLRKLGDSDRLVILKKPFDPIEVLQLANSLCRKWQLLQEARGKMADLEEIVVTRTAEIVLEQEKFKTIFENSPEGIFQIAPDGRIVAANPAYARIYGYDSSEQLAREVVDVWGRFYKDPARLVEFRRRLEAERTVRHFESEIITRNGATRWVSETACRVARLDGTLLHYQGFVVDVTAQKLAQKERDLMEAHLRQAQKLESVGQLAAGIAHEINTPIQYVGDNIRFIKESFASLGKLLRDYENLAAAVEANAVTPEISAVVEATAEQVDLEYLNREIPLAVQQALDGVGRVSKIVQAMKEFSHPGQAEMTLTDIGHAIETTITVARGEWKHVADVETHFAPDLPKVMCAPAEINQVILNLIVNAAQAIGSREQESEGSKGKITISASHRGDAVWIKVADTGIGIPEEIRHRIFDPFFTTKEVGKGTGQGLAMAWATVVDKHGGKLEVESTPGRGATFTVELLIKGPAPSAPSPSPSNRLARPEAILAEPA